MVTKEESELFDQRATQLEALGYKSSVSRSGFEKEDKYVPATLMLGASTRDWNKFIEEQTPPHPLPESVEEAAKEYMNKANPDTIGSHSLWEAFTAGALWAQKEVFEFVEWAEENYYFFIESKTWGKTLENEDNLTTSALFSKFQEWKQQQLLKS